jgi:hypothetical protein
MLVLAPNYPDSAVAHALREGLGAAPLLVASPWAAGALVFVLAPLLAWAAWGLVHAEPSAWAVAFALVLGNAAADVAIALSGRPVDGALGAAAACAILLYLASPAVRAYFGLAAASAASATAS